MDAEYRKIRNYIMRHIKPDNCRVVYSFHEIDKYPCYNPQSKTVHLPTVVAKKDPYNRLRLLLHEICHHLTWDQLTSDTLHYAEYKAEKLLRNLCRQYGWYHILSKSDDMLLRRGNRDLLRRRYGENAIQNGAVDMYGWPYAAERICREEKLSFHEKPSYYRGV